MRKRGLAAAALAVLWGGGTLAADYNRTFAGALEDPLGKLPLLLEAEPWQVSSYDRTGGNNDGFDGSYSFLRTTAEGEYVIFEEEGAGVVGHMWFTAPGPAERIRFYFDGERSPRIDLPIQDLFRGTRWPFLMPLVGDDSVSSGGFYVYVPMPFREGLRITTTGNPRFYHITYLKFGDPRGVRSFDPRVDGKDRLLLEATIGRWERCGDRALALPGEAAAAEATAALEAGEQRTVFVAAGSGIIDGLVLTANPQLDWEELEGVRLLAYWDGRKQAAVDAPLRDYFGSCFEEVRYTALPLGMAGGYFYSFFRMPFANGARLVIANRSGRELPEVRVRVYWRALGRLPGGMGRFHAQGREETAEEGKPIEILRRSGRGHYVGVTMNIEKAAEADSGDIGFLEGDEQIYIDGEPRPRLHGTGTEDYFNGGWYFNRGTFSLPFHGHHFRDVAGGRIGVYRFHVLDPVPFGKEIQAFIEHGPGNDKAGTRYRLVAYWYEDPASRSEVLSPPVYRPMERLTVVPPPPQGGKLRELATRLATSGDPVEFALIELLDPAFTGGHLLRFRADAPGDFVELETRAEIPDRYGFRTFHCRGPAQGTFRVRIEGEMTGPEADAYAPDFEPNVETNFGDIRLSDATPTVRLVVTGKKAESKGYGIALTGLALHSLSAAAEEWWVLGPFEDAGHAYFEPVTEIEKGRVDLEAGYRGKDGKEIGWRKAKARDGVLDFEEVLGETDDAVAYALTYLHAERASSGDSYILLGSDDGARVYAGGKQVYEFRGTRGLKRDEDAIPVTFGKGRTPILIKVFEEKGGWALSMRINDPYGVLRYGYE